MTETQWPAPIPSPFPSEEMARAEPHAIALPEVALVRHLPGLRRTAHMLYEALLRQGGVALLGEHLNYQEKPAGALQLQQDADGFIYPVRTVLRAGSLPQSCWCIMSAHHHHRSERWATPMAASLTSDGRRLDGPYLDGSRVTDDRCGPRCHQH